MVTSTLSRCRCCCHSTGLGEVWLKICTWLAIRIVLNFQSSQKWCQQFSLLPIFSVIFCHLALHGVADLLVNIFQPTRSLVRSNFKPDTLAPATRRGSVSNRFCCSSADKTLGRSTWDLQGLGMALGWLWDGFGIQKSCGCDWLSIFVSGGRLVWWDQPVKIFRCQTMPDQANGSSPIIAACHDAEK